MGDADSTDLGEMSLLQPLAPDAETAAFEPQRLHVSALSVDENEKRAAQRVFPHVVFDQGDQAVERFAHVRRLGAEQNPDVGFREKHGPTIRTRDRNLDATRRRRPTPTPLANGWVGEAAGFPTR